MAHSIENPILNSSRAEPSQRFAFDGDGIASEVARGRRESVSFVPIPSPREFFPGQPFFGLPEALPEHMLTA